MSSEVKRLNIISNQLKVFQWNLAQKHHPWNLLLHSCFIFCSRILPASWQQVLWLHTYWTQLLASPQLIYRYIFIESTWILQSNYWTAGEWMDVIMQIICKYDNRSYWVSYGYISDDISSFSCTNADGRLPNLVTQQQFTAGTYKLRFDTGAYFRSNDIEGFYPYADVSWCLHFLYSTLT